VVKTGTALETRRRYKLTLQASQLVLYTDVRWATVPSSVTGICY